MENIEKRRKKKRRYGLSGENRLTLEFTDHPESQDLSMFQVVGNEFFGQMIRKAIDAGHTVRFACVAFEIEELEP